MAGLTGSVAARLDLMVRRFNEIEAELGNPVGDFDQARFTGLVKERAQLEETVGAYNEYRRMLDEIVTNEALIAESSDPEMRELAEDEAKELRAQGFESAQEIRSKADRDREVLLSDALRASQTDRGAADAEANDIAVSAYARDPGFFDLYRTLQVYRSSLTQGSSTLVLAPSSALMKYFDAGPNAGKAAPAPPAAPSQPPVKEQEP